MANTQVLSEVNGSVWKIVVAVGDEVSEDQPLVYIESMKMEIPVVATESGVVEAIFVSEGDQVAEGLAILSIRH